MTNKQMARVVREQIAIDLNCTVDDFDKDGFVFCDLRDNPGRRPFPRGERHFEMYTMGRSVIVSATPDILAYVRQQLDGKSRDEAFEMPFVHGQGLYYLPDCLHPLPLSDGFEFAFVEPPEIEKLYVLESFRNAMQYDARHLRPDILIITAAREGQIAGMAGASTDCAMLWQIGIDVLPEYRNRGIAAVLTNRLAIEILHRGKIPYYGTASSNMASQRVAHRAGFAPAWAVAWRGMFDGMLTEPTS